MAETNERDAKIVQFLAEAHTKEAQLEAALADHITRTTKAPYRKRLQEHLKETRNHKKQVERRIKKLGGTSAVQGLAKTGGEAVGKVTAVAKSAVTTAREAAQLAPSEPEVMLKNAQIQYREEADEIAIYKTIQAFAEKVGDKETAQLAKSILREEERMAKYVDGQITQLTNGVVQAVVPRDQRAQPKRRSSSRKSSGSSGSGRSTSRSSGGSTRSRSASKASGGSKSGGSGARKSGGSARKSGGGARKSGKASGRSRSRSGS